MMNTLIKKFRDTGQACIAANVSNLETVTAAFEAALESRCDIILQVAPIQLKVQAISYKTMVELIRLVAKNYSVDYAIHLDHAETLTSCRQAIDAGFNSVMIDASHLSLNENITLSKQVVNYARDKGVIVEAELGSFSTKEGENGAVSNESLYTNPAQVSTFIEATGIDLLAVSIGNAHGFYKGEPKINFEILKQIKKQSVIPLVLHGSTGIPADTIKKCVKLGVFKINVFTQLDASFNQGYINAYNEMGRMMYAQKKGQDAFKEALVHYMNIIKE